ncbi:hypothetical protein Q73_02185 [Bacillus coahuilensis m2-6]|uniref:hypothetical protein n=1 Tax=Bacillus coahuilensis TaxID=408580 RepID=UPI000750355C|nr:hypothetical protein [Bacillus coahuilensis]KUP09620.1 hypothetical protein Q73_02185 [Bacillus coahuilensis m2-6]
MNAVTGTYRLIYEEMRWILVIFSSITILISAICLTIGSLFNIGFTTSLFGPIYGGVCVLGAIGFTTIFPIAIGLGSTRTQYMKSYYAISSLMVIGIISILNIIYFAFYLLREQGLHSLSFFHPANLFSPDYHVFYYLLIDLMIGFLLLGLSSFITACWRKLGTRKFLVLFFSINILITYLFTTTNLFSKIVPFLFEHTLLTFIGCGLIGVLLHVATYPIMKHISLTFKPVQS